MTIRYLERNLFVDGARHELRFPIDDAIEYEDLVVVLFEPDAASEANGQFHNLVGIDRSGQQIWSAELPTSNPGDRYYKIASKDPLVAYSTQSYDCTVDLRTGQLLNKEFTK